jgi:phosphate/sulfate permease
MTVRDALPLLENYLYEFLNSLLDLLGWFGEGAHKLIFLQWLDFTILQAIFTAFIIYCFYRSYKEAIEDWKEELKSEIDEDTKFNQKIKVYFEMLQDILTPIAALIFATFIIILIYEFVFDKHIILNFI